MKGIIHQSKPQLKYSANTFLNYRNEFLSSRKCWQISGVSSSLSTLVCTCGKRGIPADHIFCCVRSVPTQCYLILSLHSLSLSLSFCRVGFLPRQNERESISEFRVSITWIAQHVTCCLWFVKHCRFNTQNYTITFCDKMVTGLKNMICFKWAQ